MPPGAHLARAPWPDTLQVLADAAGLSKLDVSRIEVAKRIGTVATLKKFRAALGVPLDAQQP